MPVTKVPAHVDETAVKESLAAEGASAAAVAETLAELKATKVSRARPETLVIGGDQTLDCNGTWFDKPADMDQAAGHLRALSGRRHTLNASVCVVRDAEVLWHTTDSVELTVRPLDDAFIQRYLAAVGEDALGSVGGYRLEGLGAQLFTAVAGDYFTVLGLPLLPLLEFLRQHGALAR